MMITVRMLNTSLKQASQITSLLIYIPGTAIHYLSGESLNMYVFKDHSLNMQKTEFFKYVNALSHKYLIRVLRLENVTLKK